MKILRADQSTQYVYPVAHHHNSPAIYTGAGEFIYHHTNMMDSCPANQCSLINGAVNFIEIRTKGSNAIGMAGANVDLVEPHIFSGSIHDATDLILNGDFSSWPGGYSAAPAGWTKEANCSLSVSAVDATIGGYAYHHRVTMNTPTTTISRSLKQTVTVSPLKTYKLTVLYAKDHVKNCRYFIYDNTHAYYIADVVFPKPATDTKTSTEGFLHVLFVTPSGCNQITIGFHPEGITGSGDTMVLIGASLKIEALAIPAIYYIPDSGVFSGETFNLYFQPYTQIDTDHSVLLCVRSYTETILKIGVLKTGTLFEMGDPYLGWNDGLSSGAVVTDLKFGGRLIDKRFNLSVFKLSLNCSEAEAEAFMFDVYPTLRNTPTFFQIGEKSGKPWTVFARFTAPPEMTDKKGARRKITFTIEEAL